jgi:hypothetical protein
MAPVVFIPATSLIVGSLLLFANAWRDRKWTKSAAIVDDCVSRDSDFESATITLNSSSSTVKATLVAHYSFGLKAKVGSTITVLVNPKDTTQVRLIGSGNAMKISGDFFTAFGVIGLAFVAAIYAHK